MRIDPAGWPFVLGALVLAIIAAFAAGLPFGIALLVLSIFFLFFFRDPDRAVSAPAVASRSACFRDAMTTLAPASRQASAIAAPIPRLAPVTTITLFSKEIRLVTVMMGAR